MLHLDHEFQKLISTLIENAEDLDIVISVYNLLELLYNIRKIVGLLYS